ncbi:MAG: hypothetical protein R3183_07840 [Oleiphilaceae bacterium]|nr:hypothetical protein [Oleiphilaceae bacterium]
MSLSSYRLNQADGRLSLHKGMSINRDDFWRMFFLRRIAMAVRQSLLKDTL